MDIVSELVSEMNRLIVAARQHRIHLRAFGGMAIYEHSRNNPRLFHRESPDVDFMVPKRDWRKLEAFFQQMGYSPHKQFNLLNGSQRQIYYNKQTGHRIDILVGDFEMCHKLPLNGRLKMHPTTIPLAELFLSKAQIVQLNRKDAIDIVLLLLNNDIGDERQGKIGLDRIARLCARNWGLYKTTSINLKRIEDLLLAEDLALSQAERELVLGRVRKIRSVLESRPKTVAWKMRNILGTRVRWYAEVEEVDQ
ncbi:MAG TPA: nucleotidyltransferase family protein [Anaerolineales bacterium]|nr:nucleotidyltransferase family protein [Anaerolineales bacterium]